MAVHRTLSWSAVDWITVANYSLCNCSNNLRCFHSLEKAVFSTSYKVAIYSWTRISIILCLCNNRLKKDKVIVSVEINWLIKTRHRQAPRLSEFLLRTRAFNKMIETFPPPGLLFDSITSKVKPNKFIFHSFRRQSNITLTYIKTKAKYTKPSMESSSLLKSRPISAFSKTFKVRKCQ